MVSAIGGSQVPLDVPAEPVILGASAPDAWLTARPGERLEAELTPDVCILPHDGTTRYFLRGHLQLPIRGAEPAVFIWSVWVELDEAEMASIAESWSEPNRAASPPILARLATELPYQDSTRNLPVTVYTRDLGQVPLLMVPPGSTHELGRQQRDGICPKKVDKYQQLMA